MKVKLYDPRTGDELIPLYTLRNGVSVYPILGSDGSSEGGAGGDGGADDDSDDEDEEDEEDEKGADSGDTGDKGGEEKPETVDRAEYLKLKNRLKAADQRASRFEVELRKIQDADKPELEKLKTELEEERKARENAAAELNTARLENAVLRDPQFSWQDPEDVVELALKALRKGELEINEDGEVEDVAVWLKNLAKRKPHFLRPVTKRKKAEEDEDDDDGGTTGGAVGSGRRKGTKKLSEELVRKRLPALR